MNAKVRALVFMVPAAALFSGLIIVWLWQSSSFSTAPMKNEGLKVQGHSWAAGNTAITLTVRNTWTSNLSVNRVRVDDVEPSSVTYGGGFSGTAHTLVPGATGTITITQQFTSDVEYEFVITTARGLLYLYDAIPP